MKNDIIYGALIGVSLAIIGLTPAQWEWWLIMLTAVVSVQVLNFLPNVEGRHGVRHERNCPILPSSVRYFVIADVGEHDSSTDKHAIRIVNTSTGNCVYSSEVKSGLPDDIR